MVSGDCESNGARRCEAVHRRRGAALVNQMVNSDATPCSIVVDGDCEPNRERQCHTIQCRIVIHHSVRNISATPLITSGT